MKSLNKFKTFLVLSILIIVSSANASDVVSRTEGGNKVQPEVMSGQTIQSISFNKDTTVRDALRFLALKYRKNIVPTSAVEGLASVGELYDVTFEEALNAVLGFNFVYEAEGNFIKIYTREEYKILKGDVARMEYRVFHLYYITATEALKLVTPVLSGSGKVVGSTKSQDGVAVGDTVGANPGGDSVAQYETIVIYDYPENIDRVESLLSSLDIRPKQVLVEATIMTASLQENTDLGIDFSALPSDITINGFAGTGATGLKVGVTDGDNISAIVTAIETITDTTVIANPKILAINKQVGTVYIGKRQGYRDKDTISSDGTATVGEVKFLDSGTKLSFRPFIGDDGYIRMDVYPKDSSGDIVDGIPEETTTETSTNIIVKDGQSIVIGGLFRDTVNTTRRQVPLLGNIPFIGAAFRGTNDESKREEVIIMLTCHIIDEPEELNGDARTDDIKRKRFAAREEMQLISIARLAEDSYVKAAGLYNNGNKFEALAELDYSLSLRPSYIEAIRLRERIVSENEPDEIEKNISRIMIDVIEKEDQNKALRK